MLSAKVFTRIQRFVYKDLLFKYDFAMPDDPDMGDVSRQCFPISCYAALVMHHKYNMPEPLVVVGHALLHDGDVKVRGNPHAMVYYQGTYLDFTDLTRNIQYHDTDVAWNIPTVRNMIDQGSDHILAWLKIDSLYSFKSYSAIYSGGVGDIKKWRPSTTDTKTKPKKLELHRGDYTGSMGEPPDPRTIKRIGFNNDHTLSGSRLGVRGKRP